MSIAELRYRRQSPAGRTTRQPSPFEMPELPEQSGQSGQSGQAMPRTPRAPNQNAGQMPSFNQPGQWGWGNEPRMSAPMEGAYGGQGGFRNWFMGQVQGKDYSQATLEGLQDLLRASGSDLTPPNASGERTKIWDPDLNDWVRVFGVEPGWGSVWNAQGYNRDGTPKAGSGGGVFSDPATAEWEKLLREIVERLNKPQPGYTPEQLDLMQTQAIDPLERQRQATLRNTQERLGARGITGGSGVLEQALRDVDRQFDQMRSGQQTQFALNQVQRQDQLFNSNEQRALAGLNLFGQIPQYADKRMQMAQGVLGGNSVNPYQLLSLLTQLNQNGWQNQQFQNGQDQQFWNWLGQILANSFA